MRFGVRGRRPRGVLGRPGGALKASGAGFARLRSVKNHVFYDGFGRFAFLPSVVMQMAAQAALVDNMGRLASILRRSSERLGAILVIQTTSWERFGCFLAAFEGISRRFSLPQKCSKPCVLRWFLCVFVFCARLREKWQS